jgi:hypothetical protein
MKKMKKTSTYRYNVPFIVWGGGGQRREDGAVRFSKYLPELFAL